MTILLVLYALSNNSAKLEEKSRPVINGTRELATTTSYNLEFNGGKAIFAKNRGKTVQERVANTDLLSIFKRLDKAITV